MSEPEELREEGRRYYQMGEYEKAIESFQQARELYAEAGDLHGVAEMLNNLGVTYRQTGQWDEALRVLGEAQRVFADLADRNGQAQVLGNLGSVYSAQGQPDRAAEHFEQAVALFRELEERALERDTLRALSRVRLRQRKWLVAIALYDSSLTCVEHPSLWDRLLHRLFDFALRLAGGG